MKPKTKLQKEVIELSAKLPLLTNEQTTLAYKHTVPHVGRRTTAGILCLDCNLAIPSKSVGPTAICPNCKIKLTIDNTYKRVFNHEGYFGLYTVINGYQVLRFFNITAKQKVGSKRTFCILEVTQRWMNSNGAYAQIALLRNAFGSYRLDSWQRSSSMEVRNDHRVFDVYPSYVLPGAKYLPQIKRNGFHGFKGYKLTPFEMFHTILTSSIGETLLKAGQKQLFTHFAEGENWKRDLYTKYWNSIKICIRNQYIISDPSIYFDYLNLLSYFGHDLHNPHYVCPLDLMVEHNRLVNRKRRKKEAEDKTEKRRKAIEDEANYLAAKSKYFGFVASDDLITLSVLSSVHEFIVESDELKHCLFENDYHKKDNSLILSARINGKRIETVEVSLSRIKVEQSRGLNNVESEYHDRIISLVKGHAKELKRLKKIA